MAKEANIHEIVQTLQEAQQNKELLEALTTSLERYVANQKEGLAELENLVSRARSGELKIKKRGGYRGRKKKPKKGSPGRLRGISRTKEKVQLKSCTLVF